MFSNPVNEAEVKAAWESFLNGDGRPLETLRSLVDASWQRCLQAQVDPHARSGPQPVSETDLFLLCERQREMLEASAPVMACARDFLSETGTLMALADTSGTILATEGDMRAIGSAETIHLMPGASWSEDLCGTNAIGTALAVGQPVQIHSAEHFCEGIKRWTCSATVLRHPLDGEIVGVLDVSGLSPTYSRQTLALVVTAASRIENRLAASEMERRYRLLDHAVARLAQSGQDGVVLFDRLGCPIKANEHAADAIAAAGGELDLARARRLPALAARRTGRGKPVGLPDWMRPEWIEPLVVQGEPVGTLLVVPASARARVPVQRAAAVAPSTGAAPAPVADGFTTLVTGDEGLQAVIAKARQLSRSRAPVLLHGETGVGKEEFARGIHGAGSGAYVALNCGGLSRELLASELFGYAEGAFTGARKGGMVGKIEAANGGTLFLDEIGEMPLDMQPNLLRVLEQGELYRLGENTPRKVRFRLIAATHRDLRQEIAAGRFRMDLYYRIAVTSLRIPPLRERRGDIALLARHFLQRFRAEQGLEPGSMSEEVLQALQAYPWPGNVRELRNIIEGAVLLSEGPLLTLDVLPREFMEAVQPASALPVAGVAPGGVCSIAEGEETLIRRAIEASGGNLTLAAKQLGIAKSTLYVKLQRYGLSRAGVGK
ncbi:sigma-54-dependent Fis family transcriptional regulator [Azohydromonas caseinilytica]|nr:sigma-54-dependent Fis family transcriptional regulator [Azohydromonas caseinilytica]